MRDIQLVGESLQLNFIQFAYMCLCTLVYMSEYYQQGLETQTKN